MDHWLNFTDLKIIQCGLCHSLFIYNIVNQNLSLCLTRYLNMHIYNKRHTEIKKNCIEKVIKRHLWYGFHKGGHFPRFFRKLPFKIVFAQIWNREENVCHWNERVWLFVRYLRDIVSKKKDGGKFGQFCDMKCRRLRRCLYLKWLLHWVNLGNLQLFW